MTDKEKLYETLGELLFVIAKSDGVIQEEERDALKELLKDHAWAKDIEWSFDYETSKETDIEDLYAKVIAVCSRIGPSPEYKEFIESMKVIAQASNGIDENEAEVVNSFSEDLIARFQKDTDRL